MHDPTTQAFDIKYPWLKYGKKGRNKFEQGYRESFITIWHVDPQKDGTDDSCGWFKRARHGDKATLQRIIRRFEFDWDRSFTSEDTKRTYYTGYFFPKDGGNGYPQLSPIAITMNLFFLAALEHFDRGDENWDRSRKKAWKFLNCNIAEIICFAENPTDSMQTSICQTYGVDDRPNARQERIENFANIIYGWILREERPWYRHPRWHVHHWKLQVHLLQMFKRWAFSKCCKCGKQFSWGYSPVSNNWDSTGPRWFRSEEGVYHSDCRNPNDPCVAKSEIGVN